MKVQSRLVYLVILPVLVIVSFLIHSYISFHSVNYAAIQRVINMNNSKYTKIPSSKPVIRIQSWNIKVDSFKDFETIEDSLAAMPEEMPDITSVNFYTGYKESSWSIRRFGIVNDVLFNNPDIFCVQEALKNQLDDLDELLHYQWKWLGVARDDGKTDGEHLAIFVKRSTFDIVKQQTIWLTTTPYEISQYPGAYSKRVATIARLTHKVSGDTFTIINTHFDHKSLDSRQFAASLLRFVGAHEFERYGYVFLAGDLNSGSAGKTSTAYKILTGEIEENYSVDVDPEFNAKYRSRKLANFYFQDLLELTPKQSRMGHLMTVNGWNKPVKPSLLQRIDFIMGGVMRHHLGKNDFEVLRFKVGENLYDYGVQLSDHRPVYADIVFY